MVFRKNDRIQVGCYLNEAKRISKIKRRKPERKGEFSSEDYFDLERAFNLNFDPDYDSR